MFHYTETSFIFQITGEKIIKILQVAITFDLNFDLFYKFTTY